jgi:hypothetical protein
MKVSNVVTSLFLALGVTFTAQAQWIKVPLPGTPRTNDGKPNLSAPAPRAYDGHPDLSGIWISSRQYSNPKGRGLERFMPAGSRVPMLPAAEKITRRSPETAVTMRPIPPSAAFLTAFRTTCYRSPSRSYKLRDSS